MFRGDSCIGGLEDGQKGRERRRKHDPFAGIVQIKF
jgi:hypothetical protein